MELVFFTGLPASGKSTYSKEYRDRGYSVFSSDALRGELFGDENIQGDPREVFALLYKRIREALRDGHPCVLDATNLGRRNRIAALDQLKKHAGKKTILMILANPETCYARNEQRSRVVPPHRLYEMLCAFDPPAYYEGWDAIEAVYSGKPYVFPREEAAVFEQDNPHHTLTLGQHMDAVRDYCVSHGFSPAVQEAAYYHDMGKFYTKRFFNRKGEPTETAHYYGHERYGSYLYLCEKVPAAIQNGTLDEVLYVANLINWHMRPLIAWGNSPEREQKDRKLIGETMYEDLLHLHEADVAAH